MRSTASFVVVDSLDEIHPRDYVFVLQTLEKLVRVPTRNFVQVVVFGRPFSFADYWHQVDPNERQDIVHEFTLRKPDFCTTGDILVSNWNFDSWKFGLRRVSDDRHRTVRFADYQAWCERGFPRDQEFSDIVFQANQHMTPEAREKLNRWIAEEPAVAAVISNLAGNGMVREILVDQLQAGHEFDENVFMDQFLTRWLKRDTQSDDRPSQIKPAHLDAYLGLLENVAAKYSTTVRDDGSFLVNSDAEAKIKLNGREFKVSVKSLLNRSGLVTVVPFGEAGAQYRFEPLWLHRLLTSRHASRVENARVEQTPVAFRLP
jgi:hypothetical protein